MVDQKKKQYLDGIPTRISCHPYWDFDLTYIYLLKDMYKKKDFVCDLGRNTLSMMFGWLYFYEK